MNECTVCLSVNKIIVFLWLAVLRNKPIIILNGAASDVILPALIRDILRER